MYEHKICRVTLRSGEVLLTHSVEILNRVYCSPFIWAQLTVNLDLASTANGLAGPLAK